jgi:putative membrane protein
MMNIFHTIAQTPLLAQVEADGASPWGFLLQQLFTATVFSLLGIVVLAFAYWLLERLSPFSITKEIEEDQNSALAIAMGSVIIGISIIIAAAIHG